MRKLNKRGKILVGILIFLFLLLICFLLFGGKKSAMKDLSNYTKEEVLKYAKKYALEVQVVEEYHDIVPAGKLISQSISKKTRLKAGDSLKVIFSLGKLSKEVYQKYGVDELGFVPIMMYHGIHDLKNDETKYTGGNVDFDGYQRTSEAFRKDLEFYYQEGYRMIALQDYVNGVIDVPLGKSPLVLTFDDGLKNNIRVTGLDKNGEIIIDPNSAVGILEEFKRKYPDFGVTATFFLNAGLFNQPEYNDKILDWLIRHGYDIGNHTYAHLDFTTINYDEATSEVGRMYQILDEKLKGKYVPIVALPFGSPYSKKHDNFSAIMGGVYDGMNYQTSASLQVGWDSNLSPFSKSFDPQFLKRIRAYDNHGEKFDIEHCFKRLKTSRYVSDGRVDKITIREKDSIYLGSIDKRVVTY